MRRSIGVASVVLVMIAVFASMAPGAQAATSPRWLQNGTEAKLEGGKLLPITMWGTLNLEAALVGIIKCRYAITGVASDPGTRGEGDLPGEAKFQGLTAYSCTGAVCELAGEPVEITALGQAANPVTKSRETVGRITTPWEAHLNEPKAGEWHLKMGNKTAGSETQIRLGGPCPAQGKTLEFHGELNPLGENGQLIGAAPAILTFKGAESGELEGTASVTMVGKLKLLGYEAQEVFSVVNQ